MKIIDCTTGEERDGTPEEEAGFEAMRAALVPDVVSTRQMKLALLGADLLDDIEAFVATQDRAVRISWEYATEFRRDDPMLVAMAAAFGMTDDKIAGIFNAASVI